MYFSMSLIDYNMRLKRQLNKSLLSTNRTLEFSLYPFLSRYFLLNKIAQNMYIFFLSLGADNVKSFGRKIHFPKINHSKKFVMMPVQSQNCIILLF